MLQNLETESVSLSMSLRGGGGGGGVNVENATDKFIFSKRFSHQK